MASGKKRKKGRQAAKPRGAQAAGPGGELGSAGERDVTRQWAESQLPRQPRYTAPDLQLTGMSSDGQVPVIIATGGAEPPEGAGELIGTLTQPGRTSDGTVIEAGSRVYRALREITREEMTADPRAVTLTLGELDMTDTERIRRVEDVVSGGTDIPGSPELGQVPGTVGTGKPAPLGESRTPREGGLVPDFAEYHDQQGGRRIADELGWPDPAKVPAAFGGTRAVLPPHLATAANEGLLLAARDREGPGRSMGTLAGDRTLLARGTGPAGRHRARPGCAGWPAG